MPELIARGVESQHGWRVTVQPGRVYVLGREAEGSSADDTSLLTVPWDRFVSRRHVELAWHGSELHVRKLSDAANPLFYGGASVESCDVRPGEHFVLGSTCFVVADGSPRAAPEQPVEQVTFSRQALAGVRFRDPDRRIEVLSHLPEVIWGARSDVELHVRLVQLLLAGITHAEAAAVVALHDDELRTYHWDRRRETEGVIRPSARLVREALRQRRENVLHIWETPDQPGEGTGGEFTASGGFDWAFCTPVLEAGGEPWGLYVTGRFETSSGSHPTDPAPLQPDVKFAELVAEIVGAIRRLNQLEREQAGFRQFFPPVILPALTGGRDSDLLLPREAEVTVLFCDLRGFSRHAEVSRDDLQGLLGRVSHALGVMTRSILDHGGVIGDFQGDSVMGFWGWPVPSSDAPLHACRAALAIRRAFALAAGNPRSPLSPFDVGLGLSHGRAVAGKIGTSDHVKVTVFGLVVNLASRLEGMTRHLHAPVLVDETLAKIVRERLPRGDGRVRRLARVLPYGMETPMLVNELLPGSDAGRAGGLPHLSDQHLATFEKAVDDFLSGRWDDAYQKLRQLPADDRAQDFLTAHILQNNRQPPPGWNGTVALPGK